MRVLVSGSTGLIGSALLARLRAAGHSVTPLVRSTHHQDGSIAWDPAQGLIDPARLEGFDAVIHLAGENIVGRWTPEKKEAIRDSRVRGTRLLAETLTRIERPPAAFLCASASGIYGNRGEELLDEDAMHGHGFLADVCRQWEGATDSAASAGIRVVNLRFAMVLARRGGALAAMLPPFRLGVGGRLGSGTQYTSWIEIEDAAGAIVHALEHEELRGPVNIASPHPLRNIEFTRALGQALHRPTVIPVPAAALRFLYGDLADEVLLASQRLVPERLNETGYHFQFPELTGALKHLLA